MSRPAPGTPGGGTPGSPGSARAPPGSSSSAARSRRRGDGARPRARGGCSARRSSMARRAAGAGLDPVLLDEPPPQGELVGGRLVGDVVDLGFRTHELLGGAMALQAPLHLQRLLL